jgi:drug/metabolite transporter (DMT)-like permease
VILGESLGWTKIIAALLILGGILLGMSADA